MRRNCLIISLCALLCAACDSNPVTPAQGKVVDAMPKSAKRGVAFNFSQVSDLPLLSPYISWDYNWGNNTGENAALWFDANEIDFCPMCWSGSYNADKIRAFVAAHPKTKYLLAFNEPNLTDQANMTPAQAAAQWQPVVALAKELNLKLVSPAMNYGTLAGYSDPIKWMDEFFAQPGVSLDDIYAISLHCYMSSAGGVQSFIERFAKYGKPIWLTEFCAWDPIPGSVAVQMDYMCAVLNYLESAPNIERYAWFIPRTSGKVDSAPYMQLLNHDDPSTLTDLGKMYCWFSPMNKEVWLKTNRFIHAGEYAAVSNNAIPLRPSTDAVSTAMAKRDGLMVTNFLEGTEISYQICIDFPSSGKGLTVRYCGYTDNICEVLLDGKTLVHLSMPRTGDTTKWMEAFTKLGGIANGNHTLTLKMISGSCYFSGFRISGTDD